MARRFLFADESGNFDFSRGPGASRYFILASVVVSDCDCGTALLNLRRELAWEGIGLESEFHATTDQQSVRDRVFATIQRYVLRIDVTVLEKAKVHPTLRDTDARFYQYVWYCHLRWFMTKVVGAEDRLLIVSASIGTRRQRLAFREAVRGAVAQCSPAADHRVASWTAHSEPCLQVADYCAWAIQRKWERGDERSYDLIRSKIHSELEPFRLQTVTYY
jgi:hypothetical protein